VINRPSTARLAHAGIMLVFALLGIYAAIIVASVATGHLPGRAMFRQVAPLPFYLFALWQAGSGIRRIGSGAGLRSFLSGLLRRIGWALFLGGITQVFLVPWLMRQGARSWAYFDINAMTVGAIGVTMAIVARLVAEAEQDRAELDSFV
jgi:hypothetical protein